MDKVDQELIKEYVRSRIHSRFQAVKKSKNQNRLFGMVSGHGVYASEAEDFLDSTMSLSCHLGCAVQAGEYKNQVGVEIPPVRKWYIQGMYLGMSRHVDGRHAQHIQSYSQGASSDAASGLDWLPVI